MFITISIHGQKIDTIERFLTVTSTSVHFEAEGGKKTIYVNASGTWKASSKQTWIHVSKSKNVKSLNLRVDANKGTTSRSGSIVLTSGDKKNTATISIKQSGAPDKPTNPDKPAPPPNKTEHTPKPYLSVSPNNLQFSSNGGSQTITVSANDSWQTVNGQKTWRYLSRSSNQITITVAPNNSTSSLSGWFTIKMGNLERRVNVSQAGRASTLSVSSDNLQFSASGGSQTITIATNEDWKIDTPTDSWLHLSQNGSQLTIRADLSTEETERSDWFLIKAGNLEKKITVFQKPDERKLSVSSNDLHFYDSGGYKKVNVTSNKDWMLHRTWASWLHLTKETDGVSVSVLKNKKKYSRKTSFDITSGSKKITVNVEQEARIRMPFNHAMDDYAGGFTVGYIQKQWEIHEGGEKFTEGVFGNDKYLNGMQVGFKIHPQFGVGFGINTGLFYEYCQATEKGSASEWNSALVYREHGLYMPAHLRFSMNFSRWFQLAFHGGIGLNYVVSGKLFEVI